MNEPLEASAGFVAHESSSRDMHRCGKCCGLGNDMACALLRHAVKTIKQLAGSGVSAYALARLACVSPDTIQRIWRGETWRHV